MRIASSSLHMQAQHQATRVQAHSARLAMWVGARPTRSAPANTAPEPSGQRATLSAQALAAARHAASAAATANSASATQVQRGGLRENVSPLMAMVSDLIERMTGVRAQALRLPDDQAPTLDQLPTPGSSAAAPNADPGFGLEYEEHHVLEETETLDWSAQGVVRTTDGQEIRFTLQLQMQRSWREESHLEIRMGNAVRPVDPLVVNFDGSAAQLQDMRFAFDLDGDGTAEQVPLLAGNRGYLALDRNQNQRIDNGLELFGPASGNGYAELAGYDEDGNGWIDESDRIYTQLRLWTPSAEGPGTLRTLQEAGVGALAVSSLDTPFALRSSSNQSLGAVRASSVYLREDGSVGSTQHVDLSV